MRLLNHKKRISLSISVLFACLCYSQSRQFQHITSEDGISQSEVYAFLKDSQGYMWFGTVDGLNQYDGYAITVFNSENSNDNSIPNNTIRSLDEDESNRIWIGTDDGLCFYNMLSEQIYRVELAGFEEKRLAIHTVLVRGDQLFIGTSSGLLIADISTENIDHIGRSVRLINLKGKTDSYDVVDCLLDSSNNLWVASPSRLYRLIQKKGQHEVHLQEESSVSNQLKNTRKLAEDISGNLWIVSFNNGFIRYNPNSKKIKQFLRSSSNSFIHTNNISSAMVDNIGNLWIASHDEGVLFLDHRQINDDNPKFEIIKHNPFDDRSLNSNLIYSLYVSDDNLIWIGTIGAGINVFDPNRTAISYYNLQNKVQESSNLANFVRAVYTNDKGVVWIGIYNDGLLELDRNNQGSLSKLGFESQSIFHLSDAKDGNILVCTGDGISVVRKVGNTLRIINSLNLGPSFFVTQVHDGICWIATLNGVYKCNYLKGTLQILEQYNINTNPALSLNNSRVLYLSKQTNQLFIGTEGGGLNVFTLDNDQHPISSAIYKKSQSENSISNNYIRSITQSKKGDIWIGTFEGLNKLSQGRSPESVSFENYTVENGLSNNTVQSIVEDKDEKLWIGTNRGLCKFDPQAELFTLYSIDDGIQSNEFSEHAIIINEDDEIIIGGINGINTFYPDKIKTLEFKPKTAITNFYLYNKKVRVNEPIGNSKNVILQKSISVTDSIYLNPQQNSFGFEFSALVYNSPDKIEYAYILDGFDQEWHMTPASERKVNYTNLSHGDYTFKVKATNNEEGTESIPTELFISIKTPFYLSIWAYLLYGILLLSGLFFFTNYSILRYTTKEKILLDNKHNKKMRDLEELRTRFFINTSHELRTPLTLISSPVQHILREKNDLSPDIKEDLQLIERNTNKLKMLVNDIMDLSKLESNNLELFEEEIPVNSYLNRIVNNFGSLASHLEIRYSHKIEILDGTVAFVDAAKLEKIINNLLSNAIKHTVAGEEVIFEASLKDKKLVVKVIDSGRGISEEDQLQIFDRYFQSKDTHSDLQGGTGIGLALVKELTQLLNGTIQVNSTIGEGSTFTLTIPFQEGSAAVDFEDTQSSISNEESMDLEYLSVTPESEFEKKHTVLIVEDNRDMQQFINRLLSGRYYTKLAKHGKEALDILSKEAVHLVVSDVMMPEMDGYSLLEQVKANELFRKLPFVMLTALDNEDYRLKALTLGVDDYLGKPFLPEELLARTHNLLERYEERISIAPEVMPANKQIPNIFADENQKTDAADHTEQDWVKKVEIIIKKELENPHFNVGDLAGQFFLSERQFQRRMKQHTGLSPKKFQTEVALQVARELLEKGAYGSVKAIAFSVGMSNVWRFSKLYEARFGKKPSAYFLNN